MATLEEIRIAIKDILGDSSYDDLGIDKLINGALQKVAGGLLMLDGSLSPPLPDLMTTGTVATLTTLPYASLPANYQRNVIYVSDSVGLRVHPVRGGGYYSFGLFMNLAIKKDLSTTGSITSVCVKGSSLFYQGIPTATTNLLVRYYRKPATMAADADVPEGIPAHLAMDILKHYVLKEEFGGKVEDGINSKGSGVAYHEKKFFENMVAMIASFPESDAEPVYWGGGNVNAYNWSEDY